MKRNKNGKVVYTIIDYIMLFVVTSFIMMGFIFLKGPDIKVVKIKDGHTEIYLNENEHLFNWDSKNVGPRYKCYLEKENLNEKNK